jgi:asparagine synthase (glutamine-hydrolysing)
MCGIAGIMRFSSKEFNDFEIKKLTDVIAHRGPDGEGCWIHTKHFLGLGHRRLSILDLSENGAQPMHYADGRLTITFNGEIFNFLELRQELKQKGYSFHSDSDTEVLLAAYHCWGKECLHRFNGFWALALWDEQNKELWLARDRFGIKPLYYLHQPAEQVVFASETHQFKHLEGYERQPEENHLRYLLQNPWGLEGLGKTIFRQIEQIRPGHYLTIKPDETLESVQWWDTGADLVSVPDNFDEQSKEFLALLEDSIKLRLRSDVSIASALSGGLDSSAVYCTIHHLVSKQKGLYRLPSDWQRAFVAVFPGTEQDEREYAEQVFNHTHGNGEFFDMNTGKDLTDRLLSSITAYDTVYSTPLFILDGVYGAMRSKGITVSMDGHGVDEMLYGYSHNVFGALQYAQTQDDTYYSNDVKDTYLSMLPLDQQKTKAKEFNNKSHSFFQKQWNRVNIRLQTNEQEPAWFEPFDTSILSLPSMPVPERFNRAEAQLYSTFHYTVLPTILRNFDRGAMRNSIEIRMPFLDYRLVRYVFSLPMQSKVGGGFTKRILREAMKGILPEPIRTRKLKTGFNAPLQSWYRNELKTLLLDEVNSASFLSSNHWNGKVIRDFTERIAKKDKWTEAESFRLWPILNAHLLFNKSKN